MLIKICGLTNADDVAACARAGVDFCGFVFHPGSPRYVTPEAAAALDTQSMARVGVFVQDDAQSILSIMETARLDYAQLHGGQSEECAEMIGRDRVIRVLWPERYSHRAQLFHEMLAHSCCAYYLLEAGFSHGGSGQSFDWSEISGIEPPHPWFLAGGLSEQNALLALQLAAPAGLDFNSRIELSPGKKDIRIIERLVPFVRKKAGTMRAA